MRLNSLNRDMFKPFRSHRRLLGWSSGRLREDFRTFQRGFLPRDASMRALWSSRQNCSHNVSQKLKRIRRFSESTSLKHFRWERGCPWYGPSAPPGRHFPIRTLGYKRAFRPGTRYASLGLFLGILEATGRDQGGTWYGTSAKPGRPFTKGMFGKPWVIQHSITKILVSVIFFARNNYSGAGNGCANFMGAWSSREIAFFRQETSMPIKFLVFGGGGDLGFWRGGECRFYFYGREEFSDSK